MKIHLITCELTKARQEKAIDIIEKTCGKSPIMIEAGDASQINRYEINGLEQLWEERIGLIKGILIDNIHKKTIGKNRGISRDVFLEDKNNYLFLRYRELSMGERSVLMKHFFAMVQIAHSEDEHGMILEDDIIKATRGKENLKDLKELLRTRTVDYIDIAGGCGLELETQGNEEKVAGKIKLPRTRTNAAYIISKRMAKVFIENYFPMVFPIDWHLQYIMFANMISTFEIECYWTTKPIFGHGSESGEYKSWRT